MSVLPDKPPAVVREPKDIQYAVDKKLGNGGFAICYSAELCYRDKPKGKIVALKIVREPKDKRVLQKVYLTDFNFLTCILQRNGELINTRYK